MSTIAVPVAFVAADQNGDSVAGARVTAVTGNISVGDLFANPLADYVLYRCHAEQSEEAQPVRAQAHYGAYVSSLGIEAQATAVVAPTV